MKKFLLAAVAAVTLGLGGVASASTLEEVAKASFKLHDNGSPNCSAVAISPTQLVTAFHCVAEGTGVSNNLSIHFDTLDENYNVISSQIETVKVVRGIKNKDVAFLELRNPKAMPITTYVDVAKPDEVNLKFGDPLIVVGYPMAIDLTVTHGEFTGLVPLPISGTVGGFYKTTVPVTGGNSGGGLYAEFGDEFKLIGLTTAGYTNVSFMSYFSNVNSLNEVMKNLWSLEETATTVSGDIGTPSDKVINPSDDK